MGEASDSLVGKSDLEMQLKTKKSKQAHRVAHSQSSLLKAEAGEVS